jgi:hypothetical protein
MTLTTTTAYCFRLAFGIMIGGCFGFMIGNNHGFLRACKRFGAVRK